jgi:predicted amidohydrolase YtcJ
MMEHTNQSEIILHNGLIHLLSRVSVPGEAVLIRGDRLIAIGSDAEILDHASNNSEVVNLEGKSIFPGLTDAHIHLRKYAQNLDQVSCEVPSLVECIETVRKYAQRRLSDPWILGHGWNQNQWNRYGNRADLDEIKVQRPIYLTAKSLHAGWANSQALRLAGIDTNTPDPPGGVIQRDSEGRPTGILFEKAMDLLKQHIPHPTDEALAKLLSTAQEHLWRYGITAVHDFDGPHAFSALQILKDDGGLGLRVLKNLPLDYIDAAIEIGLRSGFGDDWLRMGNIKIFSDGALGPHTAATFDPYQDEPENIGMLLLDTEQIVEIGRKAMTGGFGLSVHAIGDRANHAVLDAFEILGSSAEQRVGSRIRHRIEHLQLVHPDDFKRVSKLGILASMQPVHATSDMDMAAEYWGKRSRYAYAWRTVLENGAKLAFGSDAPVEEPNPFLGMHAAVTRRRVDGQPGPDGWIPEERITLEEAFRAYTYGGSLASGSEGKWGQILPGYYADLIILDEDPFEVSAERIASLRPVATIVGGEWKYREF